MDYLCAKFSALLSRTAVNCLLIGSDVYILDCSWLLVFQCFSQL